MSRVYAIPSLPALLCVGLACAASGGMAASPAPRVAPEAASHTRPDWAGSWRRVEPELPFSYFKQHPPAFRPAAQASIDAVTVGLTEQRDLSRPGIYCQPFRFVGDNGGLLDTFEFLFSPERVTLINELGLVRRIFTDGRRLPDTVPETDAGFSVGHWEGSTLVVDTIGLDSGASYPVEQFGGVPELGSGARVRERLTLIEPDVLQIDTVLTAPELLASPYHTRFTYHRDRTHVPAGVSFCVHHDRSIDPLSGRQQLDLTPPADLPPPPGQKSE